VVITFGNIQFSELGNNLHSGFFDLEYWESIKKKNISFLSKADIVSVICNVI